MKKLLIGKFFKNSGNRKHANRQSSPQGCLLPLNPKHNDLYLVEFPKSGVTWLSFIMANVENFLVNTVIEREINFFNIIDYVADIHASRKINSREMQSTNCRIIKSHSEVNPEYLKLIYLVRDPRSVMISYYYYMKNTGSYENSISEFIRDEKYGAKKWHAHVYDWVNKSRFQQKIIFTRYEDLHAEPVKTVQNIYKYIGTGLQDDLVRKAVAASDFRYMKSCENLVREHDIRRWESGNFGDLEFVRDGKADNHQELSEEDTGFIIQTCGQLMKLFRYF